MATPTHIQPLRFFYAVGNTPAVCLTQPLPLDQDAALLLLDCGDARSILFGVYAGLQCESQTLYLSPNQLPLLTKLDGRRFVFTCCDIEAEIIARNIFLFTLLLDDTRGKDIEIIWKLYYDFVIDLKSLQFLNDQVLKLTKFAKTVDDWNQGPYGHRIRSVNNDTFV
ncbi:hypothetical protein BBP40_011832 [Aspergillus hancockii]|nr:hypothetical protein BBP40_011832 [Aspergillus hancockii]